MRGPEWGLNHSLLMLIFDLLWVMRVFLVPGIGSLVERTGRSAVVAFLPPSLSLVDIPVIVNLREISARSLDQFLELLIYKKRIEFGMIPVALFLLGQQVFGR